MLKLIKASEDVIAIDDKGNITFSGYYQENSLDVTQPGEFQISKARDPKLDTIPFRNDRDIRLKKKLFERAIPPLNGFLFKNPSGNAVVELDSEGNLYLTGETLITAIDEKYEELKRNGLDLGRPLGDVQRSPDGRGRYRHYEHGSIYWTHEIGAHEVHGDILARWRELSLEHAKDNPELGILGYPITDEQDAPDGGRINHFEYGSIHWQLHPAPLTIMQQNMALLPSPAPYKGTEREKAIEGLIENLKREQPDIVGLSECFVDGERDKIKDDLDDIYAYTVEGPDEADLESDGGLFLLSKHPIIAKNQTIYRMCKDEDCLSNKGSLHARIQIPGHPVPYDIFLSHTQNPNPEIPAIPDAGPGDTGREKTQLQLTQLNSFIRSYSSPTRPALLMGDLNTNALNEELYLDLNNRLNPDYDLWLTTGDTKRYPKGITSGDPIRKKSFEEGEIIAPGDSRRHQEGSRIDYFLGWRGTQFWPTYQNTEVVVWQTSSVRDISDHYGLKTQQANVRELTVTVNDRPIQKITVQLVSFHCLTETSGFLPFPAGSDESYFELFCKTANGVKVSKETEKVGNIDSADIHIFSSPITIELDDPGDWLDVMVSGTEDDPPFSSQPLGWWTIRGERSNLLELLKRSTVRVFPIAQANLPDPLKEFFDEGGEYAVTVKIAVS